MKTLTPVYAPPRPNALHFPFNIRAVMMVWNWLYLDKSLSQQDPAKSTAWNRGNYLVTGLGHCAAPPKNPTFGDKNGKALSGGVLDNWYAANLTGGKVDGLEKRARATWFSFCQPAARIRHRRGLDAGKSEQAPPVT